MLVLLLPPNWRRVFFWNEGIFFTVMQERSANCVNILLETKEKKRKASKQAFEEGFSFSFQDSYSEQYTFHNSSLFLINTEHTLLSQEQTFSSNLYVSIWIEWNDKLSVLKNPWDIKNLCADLVILSLEAHHMLWGPSGSHPWVPQSSFWDKKYGGIFSGFPLALGK